MRLPLGSTQSGAGESLGAVGGVARFSRWARSASSSWRARARASRTAGEAPGEVAAFQTAGVVGDGAVGLCAVIAAKERGAERIIAMSRHESRQKLAREFGATDIVAERGDEGVERIKALTGGIGADSVLECVGTGEAMGQALHSARPGSNVAVDGQDLFFSHVGLHGGPAPVRRYLPDLIDRVLTGAIDPGKVFDLTLPLNEVAEGYRAMDERRAIKALLKP